MTIVTAIVTGYYLRNELALRKIARLQEQRRLQAEADAAAAWKAYQKTLKPSPGPGYVSPEKRQEYQEQRLRQEAARRLADNQNALRRVRDWSESSGEIIAEDGTALVRIGKDGKRYNMVELATHMGRIFRSGGDGRFNMMMAHVYIDHFTHPTNLIPISISDSDRAEYSEYDAMGRGLARQSGYDPCPHLGQSHQSVVHWSTDTCNGLPRM